ncbi:MAG: SDR family NAD(P)-dependent oxidoreductase [Candidatus Nanopusillus sp.]
MMNEEKKGVISLLGVTGGIGKILAEGLKKNEYIVVGNGRRENVLADMKNKGKIDDYVVGDLTEDSDREKIIEKIIEYVNKGYKVSVFYNIGILYDYRGDISKYSIKEIRKAWQTNLEGIMALDIGLLNKKLILDTIYMVSISAHYVGGWDPIYQITKAALDRYVAALKYDDEVNNRKRRLIALSPDTIKTGEEGMGSKLEDYPKIPGELFVRKVVEIINGKYKEYSEFIFEIGKDRRIRLYGMNPSKDRNIFDYHEKIFIEEIGEAVY